MLTNVCQIAQSEKLTKEVLIREVLKDFEGVKSKRWINSKKRRIVRELKRIFRDYLWLYEDERVIIYICLCLWYDDRVKIEDFHFFEAFDNETDLVELVYYREFNYLAAKQDKLWKVIV